jgi:hypothetical protein
MAQCVLSAVLAVFFAGAAIGEAPAVRKMLDVFQRLQQVEAQRATGNPEPYKFEMSEGEVNDYLEYALKKNPRPGLEAMEVKFFDENYISTYTRVNFDAIQKWSPEVIPDVLRKVLKGKKTIWVDFRLIPNGRGLAIIVVEKAYLNNVRVPAIVVQKMMEVVGARQPEKYDLTKPLPLPFGLRTVSVDRGRARGEA